MPHCRSTAALTRVQAAPNYSGHVLGISDRDPAFRDDDGSADAGVTEAFAAFAAGQGSEQAVLTALAGSRLLVPIVAVLAGEAERGPGVLAGEKAADMAMPTLIGLDGRRAIPAFTSQDSMRAWQRAARPVPVQALRAWQAATADSCAVVIDVAGPVPLAVEGARLAALARGEDAPAPCADPDVREAVSAVLAGQLAVAGFELRPGGPEYDLMIALTLSADGTGPDAGGLAAWIGNAVMERLGGRFRRGIAILLDAAGAPA